MNDLACRRGDRVLFRGLSFTLEAREALQVVGPNGTGKSSLLRIVAGLLRPFAGTVELEGSVGLVDERPALEEHLPLGRALAFWAGIDARTLQSPLPSGEGLGVGERGASRASPLASSTPTLPSPSRGRENPVGALGLDELLDVPVRFLSTGQRKRAALARLLGQRAAVWLLDEPLNGLDTATARTCEALVADHCRAGGIALIASHQPFAVARLRSLAIADFTPPVVPTGRLRFQGRGRGWGMSADAAFADNPHPNPSPEGEGL